MDRLKLLGRVSVTGEIHLQSGLHIGAGKDTIEIGGIDNPVVKHPHSKEPYIPGSSIKGKLRFLLEGAFDKVRDDGKPWGADDKQGAVDPADPILRIFGTPIRKESWPGGPTRLMVRDALLVPAWRDAVVERGLDLTEDKAEVVIDRIAGKAHEIGPRHTERVPAGARFDFQLVFRAFEIDGDGGKGDQDCLNWLMQGLYLLELDALGGSGSRGYGRIRFENLVYRDLDGTESRLDNQFRGSVFSPQTPPAVVTLRAA